MLRIAFFGAGGSLSGKSLAAAAQNHALVAVVGTAPRRTGLVARTSGLLRDVARRTLGRRGAIEGMARDRNVPYLRMRGRSDRETIEALRRLEPDIICIAGYPWILPEAILTIPRLGAINVHTSLLPRHRGPMPLFWIYVHDDRETGVTVHWVDERPDAGDIIAQDRFPLGRGESIVRVHDCGADRGADLLADALDAIGRGAGSRTPQDERVATFEPVFHRGTPFVNYAEWDVERVWHVLAGLHPMIHEPLTDRGGMPIRYGAVLGFERREHGERLGAVVSARDAYELCCRDGVVKLVPARPAR